MAVVLRAQRRTLDKLLARPPVAEPTRAQSILALADSRERLSTILLTIPSAGVMLLTYRGTLMLMSEQGAGIVEKGEALMLAFIMGVLVWLGWTYLFSLLHWLRGKRLAGALVAGSLYVTIVACIDAPFNMLALGGGSAVQMSLIDTSNFYEKARTDAFARTSGARRLVPSFKTEAKRFSEAEAREIRGADTGSSKPGKVSAAYGDRATQLGALVAALEDGLARAEAIQADITAALARMKKHAHEQGPIRARVEGVSAEADRIDELLGRLAQFDMAVSIRATLKSLEGAAAFVPKAATKPFEVIQNENLARIADMARTSAQSLRQGLDELAEAPSTKVAPTRPLDPMTAIRTYWRPLLPQWLAALFVDLAPALLFFILMAARREAEAAEKHDLREGARA